jgi:hypothetical protein
MALLSGFAGWSWGFSLSALFMAPFYPLMMTSAGKMFPQDIYQVAAYAVSLSNVVVLLMHAAFGKLSDSFGIQTAMWGAVLLILISILLILIHPLVFKRSYP